MTYEVKPIEAQLVLTGTLEYRDAGGNLVGTAELRLPIELEDDDAPTHQG